VVLIQKLQPAFAILLASLFLKEKPPKVFYRWAILAIGGAYIMTFGLNVPFDNTQDKTALAALFAFIATLGFASSTVLSKRALKNVEFREATYLRFAITAMVMLVLVFASDNFTSIASVTMNQWYIFIAIAFLTGGPGILLYYYGLKHIKASVATIAELAFPLTAILLEFWLRGNILGPIQWLGVIILFYSILRVSKLEIKV
jgi:drug/metabolite transporter (DMT)-like permease